MSVRPTFDADARALVARLVDVEIEQAEAREQVGLLISLQHSFRAVACSREPSEAMREMLRATHEPLGFSRAILFVLHRDRGIEAQHQLEDGEPVEPAAALATTSEILAVFRNASAYAYGNESDLSAPLVDVRGWYVLSAVTGADGIYGVLYADGHARPHPRVWHIELFRALATIGALARENGMLLTRTQELAMRDPLTGLLNRRSFGMRLLSEIDATKRTGRGCAFAIVDVDDFKSINDSGGHQHGDDTLTAIARTLQHTTRIEDVVARYGGDEFVILFPNVDRRLGEEFVERISATLRHRGFSCSIGASRAPDDAADAAALLACADRALYSTKANGKNGYRFFSAK